MSDVRLTTYASPTLGCDPEFFFTNENGEVIGSELVLSKENKKKSGEGVYFGGIVEDGVQIELNPGPSTCRQTLSSNIRGCFINIKAHLDKNPQFKVSFASVVDLKKDNLDILSDKSKVFGCAPSLNAFGKNGDEIKIDAATYLKRAAGGHIHLGLTGYPAIMKNREKLIPLLDILVGNTCVMIDQESGDQKTRRLHYGRAGEYRLPNHGVEYRTLSNFWLRSYELVSLVMGLSRMAVSIFASEHRPERPDFEKFKAVYCPPTSLKDGKLIGNGQTPEQYYEACYPPANYKSTGLMQTLLDSVDLKLVERAINENDIELAKKIYYDSVKPFIKKHVPGYHIHNCALNDASLEEFDYFLQRIWNDGLKFWFPQDPITHWLNTPCGRGFESYLTTTVRDMRRTRPIEKKIEPIPEILVDAPAKRVETRLTESVNAVSKIRARKVLKKLKKVA